MSKHRVARESTIGRKVTAASAGTILAVMSLSAALTAAEDVGDSTRRLDVPDAGAAIRFPSSWRLWGMEEGRWFLASAFDPATGQTCRVTVDGDATTAEEASQFGDGASPEGLELLDRATLSVPAGPTVYEAWRLQADPSSRIQHQFYLPAPTGVVVLRCTAGISGEPPKDLWRPILETLGPPLDTDPDGLPFDARIELSDVGLAIELPVEWQVNRYEQAGRFVGGPQVLLADRLDIPQDQRTCELEVAPFDTTAIEWPGAIAKNLAAGLESDPAAAGVTLEIVELANGESIRVDFDGAPPSTTWLLADPTRLVALSCDGTLDAPDDRWRSIAETIEFLPG